MSRRFRACASILSQVNKHACDFLFAQAFSKLDRSMAFPQLDHKFVVPPSLRRTHIGVPFGRKIGI